jgi:hypothetical protein
MDDAWFDANTFGALYGAIGGGGLGILMGVGGGLAGGILIPRNTGRRWVLGSLLVFVALGIIQIAFALFALSSGQPFGIWYAPMLCGALCVIIPGPLYPPFKRMYAAAAQRQQQAGEGAG